MKKILGILVSAALIVAAVALTSSCKKDISNAKALVGTTWTAKVDGSTIALTFTSSTTFEISGTTESVTQKASGTFIIAGEKASLAGSTITLTITNVLDPLEVFDSNTVAGTFKTDTQLVLTDAGTELTFTKQ